MAAVVGAFVGVTPVRLSPAQPARLSAIRPAKMCATPGASSSALGRRAWLRLAAGAVASATAARVSCSPSAAASLDGPALRGLDGPEKEGEVKFRNIGDGLLVQEIAEGSDGPAVGEQSRVSVKYVMRRSNGYYIDASYGFDRFENFTFTMGARQVVPGFERAVLGMKAGGRKRFAVPPALGYTDGVRSLGPIPPEWGARRSLASHANETILFEVLVVRVLS